jgi:hypothetical protein
MAPAAQPAAADPAGAAGPDRPLDREAEVLARLPRAERALAAARLAGDDVYVLVRTRTRADVGSWLRRRRVWAAATHRGLVLLAAGPRPVAACLAAEDLVASVYNHVTGELVLGPARGAPLRRLRMPPLEAARLLARIRDKET